MAIKRIKASQIFDCRGEPALEVRVFTDNFFVRSSVPSTVIINPNQVREVSDEDGHLLSAVDNVNNVIAPKLKESKLQVTQQEEIDKLLNDLNGTSDKSFLGVNAILGVSVACCKAGAIEKKMPFYKYIAELTHGKVPKRYNLPIPCFNMISGGRYASNNLTFQEFAILPIGARSFAEALNMATEVYQDIERKIIIEKGIQGPLPVSDEGAFIPNLKDDEDAASLLVKSIIETGYKCKINIALDIAASAFYKEGKYNLQFKTQSSDPANYLDSATLKGQYLRYMIDLQSIISIKDPFAEDDWNGWKNFIDQQSKVQVVCDDFTVMNKTKIAGTMERNLANCLVLRISQFGTVTEVIQCAQKARKKGWSYIVSVSRGETEDSFIADMAVGLDANQFSAGAPCKNERVVKYNRMLAIETELKDLAKYEGILRYNNALPIPF